MPINEVSSALERILAAEGSRHFTQLHYEGINVLMTMHLILLGRGLPNFIPFKGHSSYSREGGEEMYKSQKFALI